MQILDGTVFEASWARKLGLFSGKKLEIRTDDGFEFTAVSDGQKFISFIIPLDPDLSQAYPIHDTNHWIENNIEFTQVQFKFGPRSYFICPITNKKCLKLIFYRGVAASREGFKHLPESKRLSDLLIGDLIAREKLSGRAGKQRLTAHERKKLVTRLSRLKFIDPQVEILVERELRKTWQLRLKRVWESLPLSTTQAVQGGKSVHPYASLEMESHNQDWFNSIPPIAIRQQTSTRLCITEAGELDIRIMIERELFGHDKLTAQTLAWPPEMIEDHKISMYVRPKTNGFPDIIFEIQKSDEEHYYQKVELFGRRPFVKPRYFICPVHRVGCDVLYFRFGYFASREAQNLKFPAGGKRMHALKIFDG